MKDILKNPNLYYIVAPIAIALWPLFIWGVYLPRSEHQWDSQKKQYNKAQKVITEILILDPDRLVFAGADNASAEFGYARAVEKSASACRIASTSYKISSGMLITSGGQKSQNAKVVLKDVSVAKFAEFLSNIQFRWANLQCVQVKLTKKKGLPDIWKVDLDFKYYY